LGIPTLFGHQLGIASCATNQLTSLPGLKLKVVDMCAQGDAPQRQHIARPDIGFFACYNHIPDSKAVGGNNISLLTVDIVEKGYSGGPVWIVFNGRHLCRNVRLVTLEINLSIPLFMPTSAMATGYTAVGIAPTAPFFRLEQTPLGPRGCNVLKGIVRLKSSTWRCGFCSLKCHFSIRHS
jgi:hypothetical protein